MSEQLADVTERPRAAGAAGPAQAVGGIARQGSLPMWCSTMLRDRITPNPASAANLPITKSSAR